DLDDNTLDGLVHERLRDTYRQFAACQTEGSSCRLLLAVSGLGPPPATDPCLDDVEKLLSRVVGTVSQAELDAAKEAGAPGIREPKEHACDLSLPDDASAAADVLVELLVRVS